MKNIIMAVVVIVCIVAGGVAGHFLKTAGGPSGASADHAAAEAGGGHGEGGDDGHGGKPAAKDKKSDKADSHGGKGGKAGQGSGSTGYYKFTREFIVPMIGNNRVEGLVILNISLEVDANQTQSLFSREPALRDNIMTTLVALSNDGRTFESITNIDNYETIRSTVLMNLQKIPDTGIRNVLILDMIRQDV